MSQIKITSSASSKNKKIQSLAKKTGEAMSFNRLFTKNDLQPLESIEYVKRSTKITNPDGSVVFELQDAEVPASWSQVASDIMTSKYFRKAGVPQYDAKGKVKRDDKGNIITGPERSAKQVIERLTMCWRTWGED